MRSQPLCIGRCTCGMSFGSSAKAFDEILAKADRMRRGEAQPLQPVDRMHRLQQLHERRLCRRASRTRAGRKDSRSARAASLPSPRAPPAPRTSRTISSIRRERSAPRVLGTMQKVQCMLQPCMIETNAVACRSRSTCSRIVSCEPASSSTSTIEKRASSISRSRSARLPLHELVHVLRDVVKFLRADHEIDVPDVAHQLRAARSAPCSRESRRPSPACSRAAGRAAPFSRAPFAPPCRAPSRY